MSPTDRRCLRLYQGFQFCFGLLFWLPVFYEYQKRIGLDDAQIFGIQSLYYVAFCLLEIPTGMVADRVGYRRSMRCGAAALVVANLLPVLAPSYPGMLAHFMLVALARSFVSGASSAWLYGFLQARQCQAEYKDTEGTARAYALVGKVLGFAGVGAMMQWHRTLPYWLTVGSASLALAFALALPEVMPPPLEPGEDGGTWARLGRTLALVRRTPVLVLLMLQGVAIFVLARICQVNLFQPILEGKALPVASYGAVMAMMTAFEAVGSARSSWLRRYMDDFTAVFVLSTALALVLLGIPVAGPRTTVALLGVFAYATGLAFPIQRQVVNDAVPDSRYRATILSLESIVDRAVNAGLAAMIGGFLARGQLDLYLRGAGVLTVVLMATLYWGRARLRTSAAS